MNILHLKYAVEVAKTRSISKAAENLYMGQPNLSRAIKELGGIPRDHHFPSYNKGHFNNAGRRGIPSICAPDRAEGRRSGADIPQRKAEKAELSVSVPRASYLSYAMADFSRCIKSGSPAEFYYCETNSMNTINSVVREDFNLGIVRYQASYEKYFSDLFKDKKLTSETVAEFTYVLLISKNNPLTQREEVCLDDLAEYIEVCHADPYVPSVPMIDVRKSELTEFIDRRIYVYERGTQFAILGTVPDTFMWVSPVPQELLKDYGLVQLKIKGSDKPYKDVLIYRRDYRLSDFDREFVAAVNRSRDKYFGAIG